MPLQLTDFPMVVLGVALCTAAAGLLFFAVISGVRRTNREALFAALFAGAYGFRVVLNSDAVAAMPLASEAIPFIRSALEYVVPVLGAMLFIQLFGERWRRLNRAIALVFGALALIAIPYELLTHAPFALKGVIDGAVFLFILAFLVNLVLPSAEDTTEERRVLRAGSGAFALFVLNEHLHFFHAPFGLSREPVGFLIFLAGLAYVIMRRAVLDRRRVTAVESELATARRIQLATLPRELPRRRDFEIAVSYLPASEVAGDYYHFIEIDESRLGVFIADVSGHGVPAALVAAMLNTAVAANAAHADAPALLLERLNLLFCGNLERQFITAFYAVVDSASATIRFATAGHPAPFVTRNDEVEELVAEGPVLGRFRSARFLERVAPMGHGDAVVFYTDGVTEAVTANGEQWGEEALRAVAGQVGSAPAEQQAGRIVESLHRAARRGDRLDDDVTLIVVRNVREMRRSDQTFRAASAEALT